MTTALLCLGFFIAGGTIGALLMAWMAAAGRADEQSDRNEFDHGWGPRI